ncbi:MAG: hypothetical protein ABSG94_11715 [Brevinematales bacterium]
MKLIPLLIFTSLISSCITTTQNRIPTSYDTMSLYRGVYIKEGDPYTGKGYENWEIHEKACKDAQGYTVQYDDCLIVPLRKNEIIKRIVIMPKKSGDLVRIPRTYIMMVMRRADWME